jgi:tricorn protease
MNYNFRKLFVILILLGIFQSGKAINDARLMRFPDINNNLVAFVYAGDIWTVNSAGGEARHFARRNGTVPQNFARWKMDRLFG